jgi:F5/8 type C domain
VYAAALSAASLCLLLAAAMHQHHSICTRAAELLNSAQVYLSTDATTFSATPIAKGTWPDTAYAHTVTFAATNAKAVRLKALTEAGGRGPWSSVGELNLVGSIVTPHTGGGGAASTLARGTWVVSATSSENAAVQNPASLAVDASRATLWHSRWSAPADPLPHSYTINFAGGVNKVSGLVYTPRQDGSVNGRIGKFQVRARARGCVPLLLLRARSARRCDGSWLQVPLGARPHGCMSSPRRTIRCSCAKPLCMSAQRARLNSTPRARACRST